MAPRAGSAPVSSAHSALRCILVVDDDIDHREMLGELFRAYGHDVVMAGDGAAALAALVGADPLPTAIVMDLKMPVMSGWELLDELARHPRWSAIPILVLSATPDARRISSAQVVAKLRKPADLSVLLGSIERACAAAT